jgi:hypothetical protein
MVLWARWEGIYQKVEILLTGWRSSRQTVTEAAVRIPPEYRKPPVPEKTTSRQFVNRGGG